MEVEQIAERRDPLIPIEGRRHGIRCSNGPHGGHLMIDSAYLSARVTACSIPGDRITPARLPASLSNRRHHPLPQSLLLAQLLVS